MMHHISDGMKKRLAQKKLTKQSIGSYLLYLVKQKAKYPDALTCALRGSHLTLKLDSREDKTKRFHQRVELRIFLNKKLDEMGYDLQLDEIRIG